MKTRILAVSVLAMFSADGVFPDTADDTDIAAWFDRLHNALKNIAAEDGRRPDDAPVCCRMVRRPGRLLLLPAYGIGGDPTDERRRAHDD